MGEGRRQSCFPASVSRRVRARCRRWLRKRRNLHRTAVRAGALSPWPRSSWPPNWVWDSVTKDGEGEIALGNSAGNYVLPTASAIQAGLASFTNTPANETISLINGSGAGVYPIINYEYAIVSTSQASPARAQDLRAFLNWAVSTGTTQLAQVNFQPLPPSVVTLSQAQIAKIKG